MIIRYVNSYLSNNQNPRHECRGFIAYIGADNPLYIFKNANATLPFGVKKGFLQEIFRKE